MVLIQYDISHPLEVQVNQNQHKAESTWGVPSGRSEPKPPVASQNQHARTTRGGLAKMFISISFVFLYLSGTAASAPHLHNQLTPPLPPLNSVTAVWGSHFIPWLSGEIRKWLFYMITPL